jgi:hypothetical protein
MSIVLSVLFVMSIVLSVRRFHTVREIESYIDKNFSFIQNVCRRSSFSIINIYILLKKFILKI